jgi:hypothetical protein
VVRPPRGVEYGVGSGANKPGAPSYMRPAYMPPAYKVLQGPRGPTRIACSVYTRNQVGRTLQRTPAYSAQNTRQGKRKGLWQTPVRLPGVGLQQLSSINDHAALPRNSPQLQPFYGHSPRMSCGDYRSYSPQMERPRQVLLPRSPVYTQGGMGSEERGP